MKITPLPLIPLPLPIIQQPLPFEPTLTEWFGMDVEPVREGWYDFGVDSLDLLYTLVDLPQRYYWTGQSWQYDDQAIKPAGWRGILGAV